MEVAVVGGGVVGVCSAYYLAAAGHRVTLFDRNASVAEETSFGNAGVIGPGYVAPWAAPGMPSKILSYLFSRTGPVLFHPALDPALWRWAGKWLSECRLERYRSNRRRMQRIAYYSRDALRQLRNKHQLDYEHGSGLLQLIRTRSEVRMLQPALQLLADNGLAHRLLQPEEARAIEPALSDRSPLAAAVHFPDDESGNCALFSKQLKTIAQAMGVQFRMRTTVSSISADRQQVLLRINDELFRSEAVVIAAGVSSASLLAPLGIRVPLYPVRGYSVTASIRDLDGAPAAALVDEAYKVAITRIGNRIRVAGTAELGSRPHAMRSRAWHTLLKVAEDWFPNAANYHAASVWSGDRPMLPDGAPLLGASTVPNVYLNIGHGSCGWAMAAGSGKVLADVVSGFRPEIDMEGLTLARYG